MVTIHHPDYIVEVNKTWVPLSTKYSSEGQQGRMSTVKSGGSEAIGVKLSEKSMDICRRWSNSDSVTHVCIFQIGDKITNTREENRYPASLTEGAPVGSRRNPNDDKIESMFTASNTVSLKTGIYARFVVHQLCARLSHKVQKTNPDPGKSITGMGLHDGYYFHLYPKVIR